MASRTRQPIERGKRGGEEGEEREKSGERRAEGKRKGERRGGEGKGKKGGVMRESVELFRKVVRK